MQSKNAALLALTLLTTAGCANTVRVRETSTGGELTLVGGRGETVELARPVMAARCGGEDGYVIVQDSGATALPEEQGQWQILYACKPKPGASKKPGATARSPSKT